MLTTTRWPGRRFDTSWSLAALPRPFVHLPPDYLRDCVVLVEQARLNSQPLALRLLAIGDETSTFAVTPANIGLAYNTTGLLRFMRRLPLNRVKEMFFTGAPVTATDAAEWGILNHLIPAAELETWTYNLAQRLATKAPLVLSVVKEQLRILAEASPITSDVFERIEALREYVYQSADYLEGIRAFQEKRPPIFTGK